MTEVMTFKAVRQAVRGFFAGLGAFAFNWIFATSVRAEEALASVSAARVRPAVVTTLNVFGSQATRRGVPQDVPQYASYLTRSAHEARQVAACLADASACPSQGAAAWSRALEGLRGRDAWTQIREVNRFVNSVRTHVSDQQLWGRSDFWATSLEFLAREGDCEDFALLKMASLRHLGFPESALRLTVVMDESRGVAHAVLLVGHAGATYVLDTSFDDVRTQSAIGYYAPQYSLSAIERFAHRPAPQVATVSGRDRASVQMFAAGETVALR
ncbi:MAG: hypothetical protein GC199_11395 [Alphaproteobacteria bacterium]|nr:hypothetical protein [Alphaproteobacteria bacterium]